ncbi:hypothetical protein Tco_0425077 [Tanacetum coccineum]
MKSKEKSMMNLTMDVVNDVVDMEDDVDISALTMEQYIAFIPDDIKPGIVNPKIGDDVEFEINANFMRELRRKLLAGTDAIMLKKQIKQLLSDQETSGLKQTPWNSFISGLESNTPEVLQHQLPPKELNPGSFTLPCTIGALMNVPIFVGTFFMIPDYVVLEDMDAYCDNEMGDVIFCKPFLRDVEIKTKRFDGIITLYNGDDEVTYQMVRSHLRFKHHTNEHCNKILPLLKDLVKEISTNIGGEISNLEDLEVLES